MNLNTVNVNVETGVHFGVTNGNDQTLPDEWFEYFEPVYYDENGEKITDWDKYEDDYFDFLETDYYECDTEDFKASYNSNDNIIMIFFSNNILKCELCSICYPNAGNLGSQSVDGVKTYGFIKD